MPVDMVEVLVRALLADEDVAASLGTSVFGATIPADAVPPLAVVRHISQTPATRPVTQWWTALTAVDIHAEDPHESFLIAQAVSTAVNAIEGTQPEGVIPVCEVAHITPIPDAGFTPMRHRNVVTVQSTARNN